jgi:hypothetical protein
MAGITTGEQDLFRRLLGKIGEGMLVLADPQGGVRWSV